MTKEQWEQGMKDACVEYLERYDGRYNDVTKGSLYEMDFEEDAWERLDALFAYLANREDIFYGTMKEVLL